MEGTGLIRDIAIVLIAALAGGFIARALRVSAYLGYLAAGLLIGPFGLGLIQNLEAVNTLAGIGVVFLMFAAGMQFSPAGLRQAGRTVMLGGLLQVVITMALGMAVGIALGWPLLEALVFGFIIADTSTMVMVKVLMDRGELDTPHGRLIVGISLIQDLALVPIIILLAPLRELSPTLILLSLLFATLKASALLGFTIVVGAESIPWLLKRVFAQRSRELFLLAVVAIALGAAVLTHQAGLSLAVGAFIVGLLFSQTDFAHQALAESTPLRDIFSILFFASVGMLINFGFVTSHLSTLGLVILAIVGGKLLICFAIAWYFGHSLRTSLLVGAGLVNVGEGAFVMAQITQGMGLISNYLYSMVLASTIFTILLTPFILFGADVVGKRLSQERRLPRFLRRPERALGEGPSSHVIVCGYGYVGQALVQALGWPKVPLLVIDNDPRAIAQLRSQDIPCLCGDAANPKVLVQARVDRARVVVVTCPEPNTREEIVRHALRLNPHINIEARLYKESELGLSPKPALPDEEAVVESRLTTIRGILGHLGVTVEEIKQPFPSTVATKAKAKGGPS